MVSFVRQWLVVLGVAEGLDVLLLDGANFKLLDLRVALFSQQFLFVEVRQIDVLSLQVFQVIVQVHDPCFEGLPDAFQLPVLNIGIIGQGA